MIKRILVVDDEQDILKELEFILSKNGFRVFLAVNGKEALEAACEIMPDLVLFDLFMPVADGAVLGAGLKANSKTKNIPTILLTASADNIEEKKVECLADDYILKPFDYKEVLKKITNLLTKNYD